MHAPPAFTAYLWWLLVVGMSILGMFIWSTICSVRRQISRREVDIGGEMGTLKINQNIRILKIDLEKIQYRDWIGERDPIPGDIARVQQVFEGSPTTYVFCCESKPGFPVWGVQIAAPFIDYEVISP